MSGPVDMSDEVTVTLRREDVATWAEKSSGPFTADHVTRLFEACRAALAEPEPNSQIATSDSQIGSTAPESEPAARPEWLMFDANEGAWSTTHKTVLAGDLRVGDVILWGDGEWRAIEGIGSDRLVLASGVRGQHLSSAALVVVRTEDES